MRMKKALSVASAAVLAVSLVPAAAFAGAATPAAEGAAPAASINAAAPVASQLANQLADAADSAIALAYASASDENITLAAPTIVANPTLNDPFAYKNLISIQTDYVDGDAGDGSEYEIEISSTSAPFNGQYYENVDWFCGFAYCDNVSGNIYTTDLDWGLNFMALPGTYTFHVRLVRDKTTDGSYQTQYSPWVDVPGSITVSSVDLSAPTFSVDGAYVNISSALPECAYYEITVVPNTQPYDFNNMLQTRTTDSSIYIGDLLKQLGYYSQGYYVAVAVYTTDVTVARDQSQTLVNTVITPTQDELSAWVGSEVAPAEDSTSGGEGSSADTTTYGFTDITGTEWFAAYDILGYAVDYGLITGYDNGDGSVSFRPYDSITRGQVATILWRMAGEPQPSAAAFEDVDYSQYYGDAINWARANGIISGYKDADGECRTFGPDDPVTREQLACMLANYAKYTNHDVSSFSDIISTMPDGASVSDWAREGVAYALDLGLMSGSVDSATGQTYLLPKNNAQRCEAAKMISILDRFLMG